MLENTEGAIKYDITENTEGTIKYDITENTEGAIKYDITEKLAKQGMQYEENQNKNTTQYALDTTIPKPTEITYSSFTMYNVRL